MVAAVMLAIVANVARPVKRYDDATKQERALTTEDEPAVELAWRAVGEVGGRAVCGGTLGVAVLGTTGNWIHIGTCKVDFFDLLSLC